MNYERLSAIAMFLVAALGMQRSSQRTLLHWQWLGKAILL
jgi:hypothetical protein